MARKKTFFKKTDYFLGFFNNHLFLYYKGRDGLRTFCNKHGVSYESARKVHRGSSRYPGVTLLIKEAIKKDMGEFECIFPERFLQVREVI